VTWIYSLKSAQFFKGCQNLWMETGIITAAAISTISYDLSVVDDSLA
jgi:hypothetical protein